MVGFEQLPVPPPPPWPIPPAPPVLVVDVDDEDVIPPEPLIVEVEVVDEECVEVVVDVSEPVEMSVADVELVDEPQAIAPMPQATRIEPPMIQLRFIKISKESRDGRARRKRGSPIG